MAKDKIKSTVKYPTSIIINGANTLGIELADSLLEQGGYVVLVDANNEINQQLISRLGHNDLLSFIDHADLGGLDEEIRRLDYVFFFAHESLNLEEEISTQQFLQQSNYLDNVLELSVKFEAKFLLTTSVKAHKRVLANNEIDINYSSKSTSKHSIYNEVEVQRYSESLVMEYVEKVNLDARILRIGELIGDGMNFATDTAFVKLVIAAVQGEELPVYKDGLSTEWYVQLLDAVYGLIKAQFSRNTAGEIFTLAYEEDNSDLSVAYKIHELESNAGEISFVDEKGSNLPPLSLYKPARNLAHIGWKPKTAIDDAIKQSLAAAKIFLAEHQAADLVKSAEGTNSAKGRLTSFLSIAKSTAKSETMTEGGPLARLINERRQAQNERNEGVGAAGQQLRDRKRSNRQYTLLSLPSRIFWKVFLAARKRISFIGNLTPGQLLFWIVFLIILGVIYFGFVSPALVLARNYLVTDYKINQIAESVKEQRYNSITGDIATVNGAIVESKEILVNFEWLADLVAFGEEHEVLIGLLEDYSTYFTGLQNVSESVKPMFDYLEVYEDKTFFRPNNESYLAIEVSYDYSDYLRKLEGNSSVAKAGEEKIKLALTNIDKHDLNVLPQEIATRLQSLHQKLIEYAGVINMGGIVDYLPKALGVGEGTTYLVLVQDNSRYNFAGGEVAAYILVTVKNGSFVEINAQSIDQLELDFGNLSSIYPDIANRKSFAGVDDQNISVSDLGYISNFADYSQAFNEIFSGTFERDIDVVTSINLTGLEKYIELLRNVGTNVTVENVEFTGENLLSNLELLKSDTDSLARRNDLIAQLSSQVFDELFNKANQHFPAILSLTGDNNAQKQISVNWNNTIDVATDIEKDINLTDMYIKPMVMIDSRVVTTSKLPTISVATRGDIATDSSMSFYSKVRFPNLASADELNFCLPSSATDIKIEGVDATRVRIKEVIKEKCVAVNLTSEQEIAVRWKVLPVASAGNSQYNLTLGIYKQPGVTVVSDYELVFANPAQVKQIDPPINLNANQTLLTETLNSDRIINILMSK